MEATGRTHFGLDRSNQIRSDSAEHGQWTTSMRTWTFIGASEKTSCYSSLISSWSLTLAVLNSEVSTCACTQLCVAHGFKG